MHEQVHILLKDRYETEFEILLQKISEWSLRYIDYLEELAFNDELEGASIDSFDSDIWVFDAYLAESVVGNLIGQEVLDLWLILQEAGYEIVPASFTLSCQ